MGGEGHVDSSCTSHLLIFWFDNYNIQHKNLVRLIELEERKGKEKSYTTSSNKLELIFY